MPSEIDINLIFLRLNKLEERIKVLEADVNNLKPADYYQVKACKSHLTLDNLIEGYVKHESEVFSVDVGQEDLK